MNSFRKSLLGCLILPLSACISLNPEFTKPPSDLASNWTQLDTNTQDAKDKQSLLETSEVTQSKWWQLFNDPVLNQIVELAWQQSYPVEIAGLRVLEAQAQLGIATGNRYPQSQALQGGASRVSPSNGLKNRTKYSLGAAASWEIDFWGRFDSAIQAADASYKASIADRDQALIILTASVVDTYAVIRITEEQLRIAKENELLQQRSYEIAQVLYKNGSDSELDVEQARTLLLSTQASIPGLQISLVKARNALSILLGKPPGTIEKIIVNDQAIPALPATATIGIPADLLRRRPDVRQAELVAQAQNALVGFAKTDLYPRFSLTGAVGLSSSTSFGDLFQHDALSYSIGPSFVWPFLNYDRIVNNVRVQDARLQQALVNYQQTVINAAREVEDAMATITGSKKQAELLQQAVTSAKRSNTLASLQYKEGLADYQRVLDSQRALFSQQQNLVASQGNFVRSLIALYKALGGGWEDQSSISIISDNSRNDMQQRTDWGHYLQDKNIKMPTTNKE
jgi:NodT family efflux transporter outer membrane factor (OMF) lipoprotein